MQLAMCMYTARYLMQLKISCTVQCSNAKEMVGCFNITASLDYDCVVAAGRVVFMYLVREVVISA